MEQFLSAKYLSGRTANQKIGVVGSTENQKVLEVIGNVGIGTTIFEPTEKLDVRGSVSVADTITATTINATTVVITGTGNTFADLNVTGLSTFGGNIDANGNLDVDGLTDLDELNVAGIATFASNLDVNASVDISTDLTVDGLTDLDELNVAGIATFASNLDVNASVDISTSLTVGSATTITGAGIVAGIVTGTLNNDLTLDTSGTGLSGSATYNNSGAATFTVTSNATDANTASTIVARDGSGNFSAGTITADLTGVASTATKLQNARDFSITGSFVTAPAISFDGTGNVSLAATITPDSIGLGTYTSGDYVKSITGTSNEIEITGGSGEGSTPQIGLPNDVTITQDLTINRDVQIVRNLNVDGNITIGGTSATLFTQTLTVADSDLILGVRTDGLGNDISNDTTANHGGIAIASTEGNPLITLVNPGAGETLPATYKKIMWFKSGSFAGLGTDAWLSNYAVGIGSTQVPNGVRLAAGNVQVTENDISVVRNINASGIITGTLDNTLTLGTSGTGLSGSATYDNSGAATFTVTSNATDANTASTIVARDGSGNFSAGTITANLTGNVTGNVTGTATTATNLANAANITTGTISDDRLPDIITSNINATSGVSTISQIVVGSAVTINSSGINTPTGIVTALQFVGTATTASFATTAFTLNGTTEGGLSVGTAVTATNIAGGDTGDIPYQSAANTTTFVDASSAGSGQVLLWNGSAPEWGNVSSAAGAFGGITIKDEGSTVGTAGSVATLNFVGSNIVATATAGANGISTITLSDTPTFDELTVTGISSLTNLNVSGISTFGNNILVGSGITMYASTGIVSATAFFGSGGNLEDILTGKIEGLQIQEEGSNVGTGFTFSILNFVGPGVTATAGIGSTATITIPGDISVDTTPQLGGDLDLNSNDITGTGNINITGIITATSFVGDGSNITNIPYDSLTGITTDIVGDTTPQLGGNLDLNSNNIDGTGNIDITGIITATSFVGDITGTASTATNITLADESSDTTCFPIFATDATGDQAPKTDSSALTYNASTGTLSATAFSGDGSGLTGVSAGTTPTENTTNQAQFIPFFVGTAQTSIAGISSATLVFNPSTNRLGVGTDSPQATLHVVDEFLVSTAGAASTQRISQKAYTTDNGTLSWEGSAGQLFSITNNLTSGSIFSVNDVSGIPSIDVDADGTIQLAPFGATELVGIGTTNPTSKLHVIGDARVSGVVTATSFIGDGSGLTNLLVAAAGSDGQVQYNNGGGTGGASALYYDDVNNFVGIGSTQPTAKLDVNGGFIVSGVSTFQDDVNIGVGGTTAFFDISTGYVGINTTNPLVALDVAGVIREELHSPTMPVGLNDDIGKNWTKVEMGAGLEGIQSLVYCGDGIVLAGSGNNTGEGDVYRSTDYGRTFIKIEMGSALESIQSLVYCGNGIVLAGSGTGNGDGDVYRSTDYGLTWTKIEMEPPGSGLNFIWSLVYCGNGIVIAGSGWNTDEGDVYRSTDFGLTWTKVEMGSALESIQSLVYCGNGIVLAGSGSNAGDGDIYKSTDFGLTWTQVEMGSGLETIYSLVYCGNGIVLAGSGFSTGDGDIYRSTDFGLTWTKIEMGAGLEYILSLVYCGNGIVLAGSGSNAGDGDIYKSTDFGLTWTQIEMGAGLEEIISLVYCGNGIVLAGSGTGTGDGDVYRSDVGFSQASTIQGIYHQHLTGNIGIGSTQPTAKLDVDGGVVVTGIVTATDFNSTSDARLKTNVQVIEDPLEKVLQINGVSFNWIKDNKPSMGVIADNIQEVLPELVSNTDPKTVNYNGLIGLLIECVKQQQVEIEELKRKIE